MLQTLTTTACAELIQSSRSIVALTGAGLSTAAGIPDFRGPRGLYVTRRYDPEQVFEIDWFRRAPEYFYQFSLDFVETVKQVQPTFSHHFLAELEKQGRLAAVITQNIDRLHQQAGSRRVLELHGSYGSAGCGGCGREQTGLDYAWWQHAMKNSPQPPVALCPSCRAPLKPSIVFFGEMVHSIVEAEELVSGCDLLLVLGSSLKVAPASMLPYSCRGKTLVINQGEVELSPGPERYFVEDSLDTYLRQVASCLQGDEKVIIRR